MPRLRQHDTENTGQDSFLDVVANIVGILIILVMVVGVRAKNAPLLAVPTEKTQQTTVALERELATEQSFRRDVLQAAEQIQSVREEALARLAHRNALATVVSAWRQKIDTRRDKLDAQARQGFDMARELDAARVKLARAHQDRAGLDAAKRQPVRIESYPTPLSRTVDGPEAHFQLLGGRVTFIPMEPLLAQFKADARRKAYRLQNQPELSETIGPVGGFRLRYTLKRYEVPIEIQLDTGRGGSYARLKRWTLIPVSAQLGESVEVALGPDSDFRRALARFDPRRTTVTIWTYADSFDDFRRLKKELFTAGFATAGRPLPDGFPIGGSPEGTKSAAE